MTWQLQHFANDTYGVSTKAQIPCVLLSGWSANTDIFDWLMPGLAQYFQVYCADMHTLPDNKQQLIDELAALLPFDQPVLLVAWSLGGNIAIELAHRYPEKVAALCLLASSPCFVAKPDWVHGMALDTFQSFQQGIATQTEKTLRRFDLLQVHGDDEQHTLKKALSDYRKQQKPWTTADLTKGLRFLAEFDQRETIRQLAQKQLWCFADNDALVAISTAHEVQKLQQNATVITIENSAHLPFLKRPDQVFTALLSLTINSPENNKQKVAQSFSKAAASYDEAAKVQQWAADYLLKNITPQPQACILDVGCGTGRHTAQLAQQGFVIGIDLAHGMTQFAKQQFPQLTFLTADAEHLPVADNSVDSIFSNLATQWSQQPIALLQEWYRVLKPNGKVYLTTLTSHSLHELRNSFAKADNEPHVNIFASQKQWQHYANAAHFCVQTCEQQRYIDYYPELKSLLRSLKKIGAQTVLFRKDATAMSKKHWQLLQYAYERHRTEKGLPLSYQLLFMVLQK